MSRSRDPAAELSELLGEVPPAPEKNYEDSRARLAALLADLSPRHQKFVASVLSGRDGTAAAVAAGYSPKSAKNRAYRLLHDNAGVMAVVKLAKEELAQSNAYTVERAMTELDDAMLAAKAGNQINALVRAIELRSKLHGLIVDRAEVTVDDKPSIRDAMAAAEARLERMERARLGAVPIDAEFREVRE